MTAVEVAGFELILSLARRKIRLGLSRTSRSVNGGCESIVRCIVIALLIRQTKLSQQILSCATHSMLKIGRRLKNGFGVSFLKNQRSFGIFQNFRRFIKAIASRACVKYW